MEVNRAGAGPVRRLWLFKCSKTIRNSKTIQLYFSEKNEYDFHKNFILLSNNLFFLQTNLFIQNK